MLLLELGMDDGGAGVPPWMVELGFWLAVGTFLTAVIGAAGVWALVARMRELREEGRRLEVLQEIDEKLSRLVADRDDLDLRRIEHVLIDLRDTQRRLEEALIRVVESGRAADGEDRAVLVPPGPLAIGERITNRLLALGYERVEIVTRAEKLTELASKDGEVLVEARREGVLHKGRVLLRGGRMADVELHPAYSIFP